MLLPDLRKVFEPLFVFLSLLLVSAVLFGGEANAAAKANVVKVVTSIPVHFDSTANVACRMVDLSWETGVGAVCGVAIASQFSNNILIIGSGAVGGAVIANKIRTCEKRVTFSVTHYDNCGIFKGAKVCLRSLISLDEFIYVPS